MRAQKYTAALLLAGLFSFASCTSKEKLREMLAAAVEGKDVVLIQTVVGKGGDPDTVLANGDSLLCWAARNGYADLVEFLVKKGADVNYVTPKFGTVFSRAIYHLPVETVSFLMDNGVDLSFRDDTGDGYLVIAVQSERIPVVRCLLDNSVIAQSLMDEEYIGTEFIRWWTEGTGELLESLMARGFSLRHKSSLLQNAIFKSNYDAVEWLLDHGISPSKNYEDGGFFPDKTPLEMAKYNLRRLSYRFDDTPIDLDSAEIIATKRIIQLLEERIAEE